MEEISSNHLKESSHRHGHTSTPSRNTVSNRHNELGRNHYPQRHSYVDPYHLHTNFRHYLGSFACSRRGLHRAWYGDRTRGSSSDHTSAVQLELYDDAAEDWSVEAVVNYFCVRRLGNDMTKQTARGPSLSYRVQTVRYKLRRGNTWSSINEGVKETLTCPTKFDHSSVL